MLRSSNHAAVEKSPVHDSSTETAKTSKSGSSLESLIAEDPFPQNSPETNERGSDKDEEDGYDIDGLSSTSDVPIIGNHLDVSEEEGWITIPSSTTSLHYIGCKCFYRFYLMSFYQFLQSKNV